MLRVVSHPASARDPSSAAVSSLVVRIGVPFWAEAGGRRGAPARGVPGASTSSRTARARAQFRARAARVPPRAARRSARANRSPVPRARPGLGWFMESRQARRYDARGSRGLTRPTSSSAGLAVVAELAGDPSLAAGGTDIYRAVGVGDGARRSAREIARRSPCRASGWPTGSPRCSWWSRTVRYSRGVGRCTERRLEAETMPLSASWGATVAPGIGARQPVKVLTVQWADDAPWVLAVPSAEATTRFPPELLHRGPRFRLRGRARWTDARRHGSGARRRWTGADALRAEDEACEGWAGEPDRSARRSRGTPGCRIRGAPRPPPGSPGSRSADHVGERLAGSAMYRSTSCSMWLRCIGVWSSMYWIAPPPPAERVNPRVHHEAARAEGVGAQHPEPVELARVQAHLVGEALRVEAPTLGVRGVEELLLNLVEASGPPRGGRTGGGGRGSPRGR